MGKTQPQRTMFSPNKMILRRKAAANGKARGTFQALSVAQAVGIVRQPFLKREIRTVLMYFDVYQLATSSGAGQLQTFRANSPFDPDFTNVGHQPMYRDQIVAMYQYYRVLKCSFHWSASTSNSNNGLLTLLSYSSSPPTQLSEIVEFSRRPPQTITQYEKCGGSVTVDVATVLGLESADYATNSAYNTLIGSNPTLTAYVSFGLFPATLTDTGCSLRVTLAMDVLFMTPLDPGLS